MKVNRKELKNTYLRARIGKGEYVLNPETNEEEWAIVKDNKNPSLQYWHLLKYHTSWDWLIPVFNKVYSTRGYMQYIQKYNVYDDGIVIDTFKILVSYKRIIHFIKWYNTNIKQ